MKCLGGPGGWGGCGREEGLQGVSLPPSASLGGRVSSTEGQTRPPRTSGQASAFCTLSAGDGDEEARGGQGG